MSTSKLDAVYRSILLTKFFTKGWGKPENLRRLFEFRKVVSNRDECIKLVERDYPVTITKEETLSDCHLLEGYFLSPLEKHLPGIVPEIAQKAHFQAMLPLHWQDPKCKPVCLHLAGTGDHYFWRRRNLMVKPLLKEAGIGGIILENPFYGLRKPVDQIRSSLHNVSDIFVMGGCLILESLVLFNWCERNGLGPLGVTGLSMGGHMASLAATNWPKPLVLVPCLSWSTASAVFLQGVMAHSINWDLLEDQYLSDGIYREKLSKMVTIVDEAFLAGKKFARTYSENLAKSETTITQPKPESGTENLDVNYKKSANSSANIDSASDSNNIEVEIKEKHGAPKNMVQNDATTKAVKVSDTNNTKASNAQNMNDLKASNAQNTNDFKAVNAQNTNDKFIVLDENVQPKVVLQSFAEKEDLTKVLKKLLHENKINKALFDKLMSNKKFVLEPNDIEIINKINEEKIKEMLLQCQMGKAQDLVVDPLQNAKSKAMMGNNNSSVQNEPIEKCIPKKDVESIKDTIIKSDRKTWNVSDLTSDFWTSLPFVRSSGKKIDISKIHWRDREALQFMRGIMDECTHLSNFSVPFDTSLIIAVCAKHDAYVPREDVGALHEIWPGAEVRFVDAGHVSAYILHQSLFRSCIVEAFERSKKKWKDGKHITENL